MADTEKIILGELVLFPELIGTAAGIIGVAGKIAIIDDIITEKNIFGRNAQGFGIFPGRRAAH